MRKPKLVLAILAAPLVLAAIAGANTIQRETQPFDETIVNVRLTQACGSQITERNVGTDEIADYFDNNGVLLKEIDQDTATTTLTNTANGKSVSSNHHATSITTYNPDGSVESTANTGLFFNFVVPGLGEIYHALGRRVLDGDGSLIFI